MRLVGHILDYMLDYVLDHMIIGLMTTTLQNGIWKKVKYNSQY